MRLTLEQYGNTYAVEVMGDDLTITDVRDNLVIPVLLAAGFHPSSVAECIGEEEEEDILPNEDYRCTTEGCAMCRGKYTPVTKSPSEYSDELRRAMERDIEDAVDEERRRCGG